MDQQDAPDVGVVGHHLHGDGWRISHPGDYGEEDKLGITSLVNFVAFSGIVQDATLFCDIRNFDELEGQSNNTSFVVLLLMAGGGILSIVVEFLQIADFVKNEGRRTTKRTMTNQAAADNKVSLYLETAV